MLATALRAVTRFLSQFPLQRLEQPRREPQYAEFEDTADPVKPDEPARSQVVNADGPLADGGGALIDSGDPRAEGGAPRLTPDRPAPARPERLPGAGWLQRMREGVRGSNRYGDDGA